MKHFDFGDLSRKPAFWGIAILGGFLMLYHATQTYLGLGSVGENDLVPNIQLGLRVAIIISLLGVLLRQSWGVIAMWGSIASLVGTQLVFMSGTPWVFDPSYLRGFIIPALITGCSFWLSKSAATEKSGT